jgi:chromosome segregation ATPase
MTFSKEQQQHARRSFIEECRQKAWNASCNADYISKHFDKLMAECEKLKKEDAEHEAEIKSLDNATDYYTKDNRDKRKALQERRNIIRRQLEFIKRSADDAHQAMQKLDARQPGCGRN